MWINNKLLTCVLGASLAVTGLVGCQAMEDHPRTTGTIGGAALGAGAGALIDRDKPGRGAIIGGVVGGVAGNVGGAIYKENQKKDREKDRYRDDYYRD